MAFTFSERDRLGLRGLLPPITRSIDNQMERVVNAIRSQPNDVSKNLYLENLHDRNETLFHRIISEHIEEMAPLIYTPTVGQVCQEFGFRFNRPRGMFFSRFDRSHFATMMHNWPHVSFYCLYYKYIK
jgi:malate dehydrogenase (oxaloacetate-decarboxylating)(NADP+)